MASLDIKPFLLEVSADSPCGEDLEYNNKFEEMERLAEGKPERQSGDSIIPAEEPDWKSVRKLALQLLQKTRDIRIAVLLTRAAANLDGLKGVGQGLLLIRGSLDRFWDCIYPPQDPDDDYPVLRMNALAALSDRDSFLNPLRNITLTDSRNFSVNLRDIDIASGKIKSTSDDGEALNESQVQAAFMDSKPESLRSNQEEVDAALSEVQGILAFTAERVGPVNAPDLSALVALLEEIGSVMRGYSPQDALVDDQMGTRQSGIAASNEISQAAETNEGTIVQDIKVITSREDVARAIELICGYYDLHEPASPVPLLLKRAKRLLHKDFLEILEDLAPDGVSQAESVCGTQKNGEN